MPHERDFDFSSFDVVPLPSIRDTKSRLEMISGGLTGSISNMRDKFQFHNLLSSSLGVPKP